MLLSLAAPALTAAAASARARWFSSRWAPLMDLPVPCARLGGAVLPPLHVALRVDADERAIAALLAAGASPNVPRPEDGTTALMAAAAAAKLATVRQLLAAGADPNAKDSCGNGVLKYAFLCISGGAAAEVAVMEADRSALAVTLPAQSVYKAVHYRDSGRAGLAAGKASRAGATATLSASSSLSDAHAPPVAAAVAVDDDVAASAAHIQRNARRYLMQKRRDKARTSARDEDEEAVSRGAVPVVFADEALAAELMSELLAAGAAAGARDASGSTPVHWLVAGAMLVTPPQYIRSARYVPAYAAPRSLSPVAYKLLHLFLEHGVGLDIQNARGATALHCALELGSPAVAAQLMDLGASTAIVDKAGCLPLHYAALGRGFGSGAGEEEEEEEGTGVKSTAAVAGAAVSGAPGAASATAVPAVQLLAPRARLFADLILHAVRAKRHPDGPNSSSGSHGHGHSHHSRSRSHASDGKESKESKDGEEELASPGSSVADAGAGAGGEGSVTVLHAIHPLDLLLKRNNYGITPLHVAAGAAVDGVLPHTSRTGAAAQLPTTFTGVHPVLLMLSRFGACMRPAAVTVQAVSSDAATGDATPAAVGAAAARETFITAVLDTKAAGAFLSMCASETATRADIVYTCLALREALAGEHAVTADAEDLLDPGAGADPQLAAVLAACVAAYDSRQRQVAARKLVSRESVQAGTEDALTAARAYAEGLATTSDRAHRLPLHYAALNWHAPLSELLLAAGRFTLPPASRSAIATSLRAHYSHALRQLRYLTAAVAGTLPLPMLGYPCTPAQWQGKHIRGIVPVAWIPSAGADAAEARVPAPGLMLVRRASPAPDAQLHRMLAADTRVVTVTGDKRAKGKGGNRATAG